MTDEQRADWRNLAVLSLLTTLLFADVLFFGRNFFTRDLYRYHFPIKRIVRDAMLSGEFPYWNRFLAGGQPLAANPAYELFYPPQWLILIGSYELGFALHIVFHVYLAAMGMYLFARSLECRGAVAMFAAISFAYSGFFLGSMTSLPTFFVWSWAPLAGWAVVRLIRERTARAFAIGTLIFGMQALIGEPVALLQIWILSAVVAIWQRAPRVIGSLAASLTIAAVQLIPAVDLARDSIRGRGLPYNVVVDFSMPPLRIFELFVPWLASSLSFPHGSPYLVNISFGVVPVIFAMIGMVRRIEGWAITLSVCIASYLLAIGNATPLYRWLYSAGIGRSLRYPEKFIASAIFALIVFGAVSAQRIWPARRRIEWAILMGIFVEVAWVGRIAAPAESHALFTPPPFAAELRDGVVFHRGEWDAANPNYKKVRTVSPAWGARNSLLPFTPAAWGIRTVMDLDYDETQLLPTHDLLDALKKRGNSGAAQWAEPFMAISGVRYVLDYRDPASAGDQLVSITRVPSAGTYYGRGLRVIDVNETANTAAIDVEASAPSYLVAAVTHHKYWMATVDNRRTDIVPVNIAYQAVPLTAGRHRVDLRYRNPLIGYSAAISALALSASLITILRRPRPRLRSES